MRGYLQRLIAAREARGRGDAPVAARPALPSRSPIAEADQRLGAGAIADAVQSLELQGGAPDPAQLIGEARTTPSYKMHGQPPSPAPARPAAPVQSRVPRYAMPVTASAPAAAAATAPHPAAAPIAPVAEQAGASDGMPALPPAATRQLPASTSTAPARREDGARPLPLPLPEMRVAPIQPPTAEMSRPPEVALPEMPPEPARPMVRERPEPAAAPQAPPSPRPLPSPRDRAMESEIRLPPVRAVAEITLTDAEPVRRPPPQERIVIRETVRTPAENLVQKPQPPQPKAPRTAAEASVIGPLPRPELSRAKVELWLR